MFISDDILDFINKIINQADNNDKDVENNLRQFRNYLELTQMCDGETLKRIDDILDCVEYLIALKNKLGYVDVKAIIPAEEEKQKTLKRVRKASKPRKMDDYEEKHYHHYSSSNISSCGSSSGYSSSCGSSSPSYYSSGCGGGSYRSGC